MARASSRRLPFHPDGPFTARKNATVSGLIFTSGLIYTGQQLTDAGQDDLRRRELLFNTRWMDMSTPEELAAADMPVPITISPPTALMGSDRFPAMIAIGETEYQLGAIVRLSHEATGLTVDEYNALSAAERDASIQAVIDKLTEQALADDAADDDQAADDGQQGSESGGGGTGEPAEPEAPPAAPPGAAAFIKHAGFGKWFTVDAAGKDVAGPMNKATAEATKLPKQPKPVAPKAD